MQHISKVIISKNMLNNYKILRKIKKDALFNRQIRKIRKAYHGNRSGIVKTRIRR